MKRNIFKMFKKYVPFLAFVLFTLQFIRTSTQHCDISDERNCDYSESVSLSDKSEHSLDNLESLFNHESSLDNLEHSIDNEETVLKRHSENAEHSKENFETSEAEHEKKSGSSHRSVGSKVVEPILHQNSGYGSKLTDLLAGVLITPQEVVSPVENAISIGMVIVNTRAEPHLEPEFANRTASELEAMLRFANRNTPLHFIIVTDERTAPVVGHLMSSVIRKKLSQDIIKNVYEKDLGIPPLYFSLVDYRRIKAEKPEFVHTFRNLNGTVGSDKYDEDFFYIAPLYHLAFTSLKKMIVLDCHDLEFHDDISKLAAEFTKMDDTEAVMGIGLDLSLHYRVMLTKYAEVHPDTQLGHPGPLQGFNSGVVLYDLEKMRKSQVYNSYLEPLMAEELLAKYLYRATLAEQDWMTNLGFSYPELFHVLPCHFNAQTSIQYMSNELVDVFDQYHYCDEWENLKIIHLNGCGPGPEHCGNNPNHKSQKYKEGAYFNIGFAINWDMIEKVRTGKMHFIIVDDYED